MPNHIPISGATAASGGILLPEEQGQMLANGLLAETGALTLAGDARTTNKRKSKFPIWLGKPTAEMVGEGERKPVTGAEFGSTEMNVKKIASIVIFTDEQIEDVEDGDMNVLVDTGVRDAIGETIDRHFTGFDGGATYAGGFDTMLRATTQAPVAIDLSRPDGVQLATSKALGKLERNGYRAKDRIGALLGFGFDETLRDAREVAGSKALYGSQDPLYGLANAVSTNLPDLATAAVGDVVGYLVYKPNVHVRIRHDVRLKVSTEASIELPDGTTVNLYQDNLTAVRYETRLAKMIHDLNRAVVPLTVGVVAGA